MRKIRVALGSDDGKSILPDHMGQAKDFYVFDISEDGSSVSVDVRKNTSPEENRHGLDEKRVSVTGILEDCDVLLASRMSPNFVKLRDRTKFQPVISKISDIEDCMKLLAANFDHLWGLVDQRRRGARPKEIPVLKGDQS